MLKNLLDLVVVNRRLSVRIVGRHAKERGRNESEWKIPILSFIPVRNLRGSKQLTGPAATWAYASVGSTRTGTTFYEKFLIVFTIEVLKEMTGMRTVVFESGDSN